MFRLWYKQVWPCEQQCGFPKHFFFYVLFSTYGCHLFSLNCTIDFFWLILFDFAINFVISLMRLQTDGWINGRTHQWRDKHTLFDRLIRSWNYVHVQAFLLISGLKLKKTLKIWVQIKPLDVLFLLQRCTAF